MSAKLSPEPQVKTCYEAKSGTWQYIVADPSINEAVFIDPVLDFDAATNRLTTESADQLLELVAGHNYTITYLLETHIHTDHLTAFAYLQNKLIKKGVKRPSICIGKRIEQVQSRFGGRYLVVPLELQGAFDHTFEDREVFFIGTLQAQVHHLPGHTPDHIGYMICSNVYTKGSILNPDVGSTRCDFPGGSALALYGSITKLLTLSVNYRLYTGHGYRPDSRQTMVEGVSKATAFTTVGEQRSKNKHVKGGTMEEDFVRLRLERDAGLAGPKIIHQALQFNIRAGHLPAADFEGYMFFRVPLKLPQTFL